VDEDPWVLIKLFFNVPSRSLSDAANDTLSFLNDDESRRIELLLIAALLIAASCDAISGPWRTLGAIAKGNGRNKTN
jgi:hypothetical protein